jgi:hypothetical protein
MFVKHEAGEGLAMTESQTLQSAPSALAADYLIVGAGAVGMAFVDTLVHDTDATAIIMDRHHAPGGHWNDAYPFVRLHQPSSFYGVNSRPLGQNAPDTDPLNAGMTERASSTEILAYYEQVMQSLLATGRVRYFPACEFMGGTHPQYSFRSLVSGETRDVTVRRKRVDTTFIGSVVPSTHPPRYAVAPGVSCVPVNGLARMAAPRSTYVIVGAGKTGIDACLWLLERGVSPDAIVWIMPRDAWFVDRAGLQKGDGYFEATFGNFARQMEASAQASSIDDLMDRLEADGVLLRLDPSVKPTMYHGAMVSRAELDKLRQIRQVVRMGRIQRIEAERIVLDQGSLPTQPDWLYVDCSSCGITRRPPEPVFQGHTIVPQMVRTFQPAFSTAFIAHLESTMGDEAEMNKLCTPIPMSDVPRDWAVMTVLNLANSYRWSKNTELDKWVKSVRLDAFSGMAASVSFAQPERMQLLMRYAQNAGAAAANLKKLLAESAVPA